jgi:aminoglycoside phosphotransferase (APT) family kinase protein
MMWTWFRGLPASGELSMSHKDLIPANLLVRDGHLVGVLDTGGFAAADPALDLVVAWHLFDAEPREVLRNHLASSTTEWARGAAWAFQQAMGLVWYYEASNPAMSDLGRSTLDRIFSATFDDAAKQPANDRSRVSHSPSGHI